MAVRKPSGMMIDKFSGIMAAPPFDGGGHSKVLAVAVSGGPDSMALAHLLCQWSEKTGGPDIHILSVDHGLRKASAQEVRQVQGIVSGWPKARHSILIWDGEKPDARIQEEARSARYGLFEEYCLKHSIHQLYLAHHGDDQIETFLFRLSKGSGLDGLCAMRPVQNRGSLTLCRPLLEFAKNDLVQYCRSEAIPFVEDPSNQKDEFARARLRKIVAALEEEGLSFKRLSTTTQRLERARICLENMAHDVYKNAILNKETDCIVFNYNLLVNHDFEPVFRAMKTALDELVQNQSYGPRTEKLEALVDDLMNQRPFRKRSLGGVIFQISDDRQQLFLQRENI